MYALELRTYGLGAVVTVFLGAGISVGWHYFADSDGPATSVATGTRPAQRDAPSPSPQVSRPAGPAEAPAPDVTRLPVSARPTGATDTRKSAAGLILLTGSTWSLASIAVRSARKVGPDEVRKCVRRLTASSPISNRSLPICGAKLRVPSRARRGLRSAFRCSRERVANGGAMTEEEEFYALWHSYLPPSQG